MMSILMSRRLWTVVLVASAAAGLSGCGDSGTEEVREWMDGVKRETKVAIKPLPAPKNFSPFVYSAKNTVDPYNPAKLAVALARLQAKSSSGLKPNIDRRREPLEAYPLDTVKMVGTLERPGASFALLQAGGTIHQAKIGTYVGQNFGMITKVTENGVELKEIVQDAAGEWVERSARLELQESKK